MKNKLFADSNCKECSMQDMCPAPKLNWCPEIHNESRWEMHI